MNDSEILYEKRAALGWITFNRPEKMNAVTYAMLTRLESIVAEASADDGLRVLIVTGAGRAFCAGTDLHELSARPPTQARGSGYADAYPPEQPAPWTFLSLPKPVIAAVNGAAVGLGTEFALQADIRLAAEGARFGWVHALRGLTPDTGAGTYLLPRVVGLARAARLLYTGAIIDAAEARRIGLVEQVTSADALLSEAEALGAQIAAVAPLAIEAIKRTLYQSLARDARVHVDDNTATLTTLFASEDHREGVRAFLERRPAMFQRR